MFRYIVLFIFSIVAIDARVNPFFPPKDDQTIPVTTNTPETHEPLRQATLSLPSNARIIKEVSVEYINLDGSTERKSITLENSIDWHLPVVISQANVNNTVMNNIPIVSRDIKIDNRYRELANFQFISFVSKNKSVRISTKDKYVRNFLIVNPYRIVVDFKGDYDFRSLSKVVPNSIIKSIHIGNHNGFYRVVLELDGQYKYNFSEEGNGCLLNLK